MESNEEEILKAFRDFIYYKTGWLITRDGPTGEFIGKTAERYKAFKYGWLSAKGLDVKADYLTK